MAQRLPSAVARSVTFDLGYPFNVAYTVGIFSGRESASVFLIFVRKYSLIH